MKTSRLIQAIGVKGRAHCLHSDTRSVAARISQFHAAKAAKPSTNHHHRARHMSIQTQAINNNSGNNSKEPNQKPISKVYTNGHLKFKQAAGDREQLKTAARRIVVKVGSAIITHDKGHLSAPRLASIVEQIAQLQQQGRQMLLVSSGAVAFGRKKIRDEVQKSKSIRETISDKPSARPLAENRAAAAVGQSSLMSFYESLFQQYDCKVAQVLVTKADFSNDASRRQLRSTILDLLSLNIVPIVNTNDAVEAAVTSNLTNGVLDLKQADMTDIIVEDNDSLAAILAVELESDLMIILSNVDGIYTGPPEKKESKFLSTFTPEMNVDNAIEYGSKSDVGLGGMQAKVKSGLWALKRGTSVVICNGSKDGVIERTVQGDKVGTFFTEQGGETESSQLAIMARDGSKALRSIGPELRSRIIIEIAQALETNKDHILAENKRDLVKAKSEGLEDVLLSRLKLTDAKLNSLSAGLYQIAEKSKDQVERTLKTMKISESLTLKQITCPIGVLLVIFESRPDCLPQISALSLATANGLLLKGGKEAFYSNACLYKIIKDILGKYNCQDAIQLVDSRERVNELVGLSDHIDLIIPRGSNQLVRSIQEQAKTTPVLGHAEGICHVYIDKDANEEEAIKIVVDSKCDYPSACNAMETLLIHRSLVHTNFFSKLCNELKENKVKLNIGSQLGKELPFYNSSTTNYRVEYSSLECTLEVVDSLKEAVDHINRFGSGHTDAIVTRNEATAKEFAKTVESASVFTNCSTRFADGYRFGLGAEVGISTSKIHARGPAGMESLMTHKWILEGSGDTVADYEQNGDRKYLHEEVTIVQ